MDAMEMSDIKEASLRQAQYDQYKAYGKARESFGLSSESVSAQQMPQAAKSVAAGEEETVLEEAQRLVNGDRAKAYGKARESFGKIAEGWELVLGAPVTAEQVILCMIWLKMVREFNGAGQRDNIVDIAGYAGCYDKLERNL
jgi:hypothetical protein